MNRHESQGHAARLDALLAAADDPQRAFDASDLASCDECQQVLQEHIAMADMLDDLGQDERENIAAAMAEPAPAAGRAEAALRAEVLRAPAARMGRLRMLVTAIAAAAAILLTYSLWPDAEPPFDPGTKLGGDALEMQPHGQVDDFGKFTWTYELSDQGWFKVYVYEKVGETLELRRESPRLEANTWNPSVEIHRAWPDKIQWKLEIYSGATETDISGSWFASAQRSP